VSACSVVFAEMLLSALSNDTCWPLCVVIVRVTSS
jgi:hypothetical protein